jgi:hypothetical protein
MSFFGYRRELSKYEDVDEDELLASLSPEELAELEKELTDIDPDANVPTGLRQRDQTDKTPTGTFSRDALMKYWECETQKLMEDEISGGSPKLVGLELLFCRIVIVEFKGAVCQIKMLLFEGKLFGEAKQ